MKRPLAVLLGAACLICWCPRGSVPRPRSGGPKTLDDFGNDFVQKVIEAGIVGASLVVINPDEDLLEIHFGLADRDAKRKPDGETIYDWGSITKLLTCIAIMQLDRRGRLALDDPVVKYIPAFRKVNSPFGNADGITLRMLMSHASGLQEGSFLIPIDWDMDWPVWEQIEPVLNYLRVERTPGSAYGYSNLGTMILGRVIEVVTGEDYEVYVDKNIFKPLGMHHSYFDTTPYHLMKNKARSYHASVGTEPGKAYGPDADQGFTTTNGGWKSSVLDFKAFVRFLLGSKNHAFWETYEGVLPRRDLESMWAPLYVTDQPGMSVGLEFLVFRKDGGSFVGHSGGANGFTSNMTIHLDSKTGFFMAGNTDGFTAMMNAFRDSLVVYLAEIY